MKDIREAQEKNAPEMKDLTLTTARLQMRQMAYSMIPGLTLCTAFFTLNHMKTLPSLAQG
jgi:hypothetical protein